MDGAFVFHLWRVLSSEVRRMLDNIADVTLFRVKSPIAAANARDRA
jgi:hypothetical protein